MLFSNRLSSHGINKPNRSRAAVFVGLVLGFIITAELWGLILKTRIKIPAKRYIYVYTYTGIMATKTISIMDDAYGMLLSLKKPEESFSDEIRRLATAKGSIMEFAGAWSDITEGEARKMKARISERRGGRSRLDELHKKG